MATRSTSKKLRSKSLTRRGKNPAGGLTEEGRRYFKKKEGSYLRPGVKKAESAEELRRKGSFLRRFYGRKKISPLKDRRGEPTA